MSTGLPIIRAFGAPQQRVYDLWTRPEHFAVWFGTAAVHIPSDRLDYNAEVDGVWNAVMILPDGSEKAWTGEFVVLEAPSKFVFTMTDEPSEPARGTITVDFEAQEGQTIVTMDQQGIDHFTPEQLEALVAGWGFFFDAMDALLLAPEDPTS